VFVTKNILFIMADQLRWDYLSCYGHPYLQTPNIDSLANSGVQFTQAYCQAALCGPSRASIYTGRYMSSHGAMANSDPLKLGELTLTDYLRPLGYRCAVIGKTHTFTNAEGLARFGKSEEMSNTGSMATAGFEPVVQHEGLYPDGIVPEHLTYNDFLHSHGYDIENPWEHVAQKARSESGDLVSGWHLRNAHLPSLVPDELSETAFCTDRAIEFIEDVQNAERPWCLHLSYIKPHWPILANAPYHDMYDKECLVPVVKSATERVNPHPVVEAFMAAEYSQSYADDTVREHVVPAYMGMVKQLDDHLGRLFAALEANGQRENTIIVFTSDHGDYLGDHWLGEKDLFHDCSVKVPLLICDPDSSADASRGQSQSNFVELIDLVPTLVDLVGGEFCEERMEGLSLLPLLRNEIPSTWRDFVVSELDYSDRGVRDLLQVAPYDCRGWMIRTVEWKYIFYEGHAPQLFDLLNDPQELLDLAPLGEHDAILTGFSQLLFQWFRKRKVRTETPAASIMEKGPELDEKLGLVIGRW
jgi:arylsulfatase A-like enzyme